MTVTPEWLAIIAQLIAIVFLAGKGWSRIEALESNMSRYETRLGEKDRAAGDLIDRLARIEEKLNHIDDAMNRRHRDYQPHRSSKRA